MDIDTSFQDYAVCPWCGHNHLDDNFYDGQDHDCMECGKPFCIYTEVYYTTKKAEDD